MITKPAPEIIELFPRECPLCDSTDKSNVFAPENIDRNHWNDYSFASRKLPENAHFRLVLCPTCALLYADPIPNQETLLNSYVSSSFDSGRESFYASQTYARLISRFLKKLPDQAAALDVGAGDGHFLERLVELGFKKVIGVEPSQAPIAAAKESIRPLIKEGIFRTSDFDPASFTLITCFQTFEHLYDPAAVCQDFFTLLKPGGAVLLVFHNRQAISAKIMGLKSPIYDVEHLQLFSPESGANLLIRSGFQNITVATVVNRYPLAYWARLTPLPQPFKKFLLKILNQSSIGRISIPLPAGNFAIFAIK